VCFVEAEPQLLQSQFNKMAFLLRFVLFYEHHAQRIQIHSPWIWMTSEPLRKESEYSSRIAFQNEELNLFHCIILFTKAQATAQPWGFFQGGLNALRQCGHIIEALHGAL